VSTARWARREIGPLASAGVEARRSPTTKERRMILRRTAARIVYRVSRMADFPGGPIIQLVDTRPRDERADSLRKAAQWRDATPEERDQASWAACRAAAKMLAERPDRDRILAYEDPLPEASRSVLERLKREHRRKTGRTA